MPRNSKAVDSDYLIYNEDGDSCSPAQKRCISACEGLTASVKDRRNNGGTKHTIRARALDLIRVLVTDLETE
jgi:hypothetical protein